MATPPPVRRLIQDFVAAPLPYATLHTWLELAGPQLPKILADAACPAPHAPPAGQADGADSADRILVRGWRERGQGRSTALSWGEPLFRLPPFDGELELHGLPAGQTWIGIEGAVSLAHDMVAADRQLLDARVRFRDLLVNLSAAVSLLTAAHEQPA